MDIEDLRSTAELGHKVFSDGFYELGCQIELWTNFESVGEYTRGYNNNTPSIEGKHQRSSHEYHELIATHDIEEDSDCVKTILT